MPTPKQLFVLRHAKSSWDDPLLVDHDRPLAPRGHKAATLMAAHVREAGIDPALVLCSSSRRTRETLGSVLPGHEALIEPELYGADYGELIERLRRVPAEIPSVMVIGHNPAMQMLVLKLTAASDSANGRAAAMPEPDALRSAVEHKFPTGALATLAIDGDWPKLGPGHARLVAFVRPKSLA